MTPVRVCLLSLLPLVCAVAGQVNWIANGSFDSGGMNPWFQNLDGVRPATCGLGMTVCEYWNPTQAFAHSGLYSVTDAGNLEMRQNFAPVATSEILQLGFWVMNLNPFDALVGYELFYADNPNPYLYLNSFVNTIHEGGWTYIDMTRNLQNGRQLVGIAIGGYDRSPSTPIPRLYVDDVILSVNASVPEASPSLLVGSGLLGLTILAARRRRVYR